MNVVAGLLLEAVDVGGKAVLLLWLAVGLFSCQKSREKSKTNSEDQIPQVVEEPKPASPQPAPPPEPIDPTPLMTITNLTELILGLNTHSYYHHKGDRKLELSKVKIAVLDNGFMGLKMAAGKTLPPDVKVEEAAINEQERSPHGTVLAQLAFAVATGESTYDPNVSGPQLLLLNSNGISNLRTAVDKAIAANVDMLLYAQVWSFSDNFDGAGFINKEVNRALDHGILWINAVGNYGKSTYFSGIGPDGGLRLPFQDRYVRFVVKHPQTPVKVTLTWNDFTDSSDHHSERDLDLFLETETGQPIAASQLKQNGKAHEAEDGHSQHARETLDQVLGPGTYLIRVENKSNNFNPSSRARITVGGYEVEMVERSLGHSVLVPADNPRVLTIGASDIVFGSFHYDGKQYFPSLQVPSSVQFDSAPSIRGTSTAAAVAAGALAQLFSLHGKMTKDKILEMTARGELSFGPEKAGRLPECVPLSLPQCNPFNGWKAPDLFVKPVAFDH